MIRRNNNVAPSNIQSASKLTTENYHKLLNKMPFIGLIINANSSGKNSSNGFHNRMNQDKSN